MASGLRIFSAICFAQVRLVMMHPGHVDHDDFSIGWLLQCRATNYICLIATCVSVCVFDPVQGSHAVYVIHVYINIYVCNNQDT